MGWCERCGRFFILNTDRTVSRSIGARGVVGEIIETVCRRCLSPLEQWDEDGFLIDKRP